MSNENDTDDLESLKERTPEEIKNGVKPYHKDGVLRKLYHDRGWSQADIGDFFGVTKATISRAMNDADIETRPSMDQRERKGVYRTISEGWRPRYIVDDKGGRTTFYESQLIALLDNDPYEVFSEETHVHHQIGSPLHLNHQDNLSVIDRENHSLQHANDAANIPPSLLGRGLLVSSQQ